ncbi:MAG: hypothetical protein LBE39_15490 [Flavobacteriaceae bacterium]|jgi:hypothetical protein|uniref:hypothetical protein n=1 Tax=Elizabethkingia ursingii TaxID=1756150 RepID=UPI0020131B14|nr:hypothetical protein [Elizabethkingia ursingii]MCL1664645.1 hypothetical protein [Elizabethkingia ursingii]MDR2230871.1 hypothetical protein [Flavobacteriaceae bacterium]
MMKNNDLASDMHKQEYTPPVIHVMLVEMENGIAAGSATTVPNNINKEVLDEWEEDPNDSRNIIL